MKQFHFIMQYIKKHKYHYIAGIITLFIVDLLNLVIPKLTGTITDGLQSRIMSADDVLFNVIKIFLIGLALAIGRFLWRYFLFGSARKIEFQLRNDLFSHLETLSVEYYNKNKTGDLMTHFTSDLNAVRMSIGPAIITAFDASVMTIMVVVQMILYVDLKLTLLAVIPMTLITIGELYYGKLAEKRFVKKQEAFSHLTDQVQESISGIRVIKSFVQERQQLKAFAKSNQIYMEKNLQLVKLMAIVMPLLDVIIGFSSLITLVYGGYLTIVGEITLGRFIAFNQYIAMLIWPMIAAGESITLFSQGSASIKRIMNIFGSKAEVYDDENVSDMNTIQGEIEFNHMTFFHQDQSEPNLFDITLKVPKGSTLAIVGKTGSGKSSIVNLLLRLYNTKPGMLFIDGIDINQIPLKTLRENISYVPQDNFLFSDTLRNNIAFGACDNNIDSIHQAAKAAVIHDNIIDFPYGYETVVGERGVTLSGGQKQRSSIARAILKDAPILILDDSLSAVDTDTEEKILSNLNKNRKDKTTIIIAHRISTIQNADSILVLEEGKAVEYGAHKELLEKNGLYKAMYEKQQLEKQLEGEM
ncbi:MAG: ABC transporter ATP-binding protein [Clostridiales bacterium]|nr:ABC transporter ATP-binding protein [Clostridiales bacterium]